MREKRISNYTRNLLISVAVLIGVLIFSLILRTNVKVCEFICRYFVNAYQQVAGRVFAFAPYNVFEALAAVAVLLAITCVTSSIVFLCKKKKSVAGKIMLTLATVVLCVINIYIFTAGFAYNRKGAPVGAYEGEVDADFALQTYAAIVEDYNSLYDKLEKDVDGAVVCPYTRKDLANKIRDAIDSGLTDSYYYKYTPKAKAITCSEIMAQCHVAGITFLPTVEPGYNKDMSMTEQCTTIAHEFAHAKGVMREDEANVVGIYALLNSQDDYLRYCAYFNIVGDITHFLPFENRAELKKQYPLNDGYKAEWKKIGEYWETKTLLGNIGEFFNNIYLKINGQKEGTDSYDEKPSTDRIDSGQVDEEGNTIYIEIITQYTKMDRMLLGYCAENLLNTK